MLKQLHSKCTHLSFGKNSLRVRRSVGVRYITYDDENSLRWQSMDVGHSLLSSEKNRSSKNPPYLPSQSQIVIAGAGTVANSVAYHLILNGWNDVLVLEQNTRLPVNSSKIL
ncbi:PREDICTED: pyruvate dehydrogenase phosphatase regulatory subunit, mitochondrial-like isoform X2 [Wasmannia auropunctata]|uniref:pyruvate dehydrogenase phosphatase regulatory subunit, mitochondrial-like isoform X2 n=1 Tax=Wasmannia auropunctata TaxID=64793 RepID=UPI0005EF7253|nr:PREDICTED: pyruvate dehydrogenase phosphatase regulatory subunit, mitochondrial-like isoform X2 [Wasmannia auropunctata]